MTNFQIGAHIKKYEAKALIDGLISKDFDRFKHKALRSIGAYARRQLTRDVAGQMGIAQKYIRRSIGLRIQTIGLNQAAIVSSEGAPMPLKAFNPKQQKRGVTAGAWGKKKFYQGLFFKPNRMGGHVFKASKTIKTRSGKARLVKAWGAGVAKEAADQGVQRLLDDKMQQQIPKIIDKEYKDIVRRIGIGNIKQP